MEPQHVQDRVAADGERRPFLRRHRWIVWTAVSAVAFLGVLTMVLAVLARHVEPYLRARIIEGLSERFHARVDLDQFHIDVRHGEQAEWGLWATGHGLRIWRPNSLNQSGEAPLVELQEFRFHVPLRYAQTQSLYVPEIRLNGLEVHIPPHARQNERGSFTSAMATPPVSPAQQNTFANVRIGRVIVTNAQLVLEQSKPEKPPMVFDIAKVQLKHLIPGKPVDFVADLTNPSPRGAIHTAGTFGPWERDDPGASPMQGSYEFKDADLSTIKDIAGTLQSTGTYAGVLGALNVNGTADVPDFRLTKYGDALPLKTSFKARVDGTNGDTWLDQVDAALGTAQFVTSGKVVRVRVDENGKPAAGSAGPALQHAGHIIDLLVNVAGTPVGDFLRLVSHAPKPILTGEVFTKATLHIPPGSQPVPQRIKLDGTFQLQDVRFTDAKLQQRLEDLSQRGLGHPGAAKKSDPADLRSQMQGDFHLAHAVITLPNLDYSVPGCEIRLQGTYALSGALHFDGDARMQATVSQMVGGWKGFLLKPTDRFFKKDGAGALIPVKIRGTRRAPDFGIDIGRIGHTHPQRPGKQ
jgi:hypothetical protein